MRGLGGRWSEEQLLEDRHIRQLDAWLMIRRRDRDAQLAIDGPIQNTSNRSRVTNYRLTPLTENEWDSSGISTLRNDGFLPLVFQHTLLALTFHL